MGKTLSFRQSLFWDADITRLDPEKHAGQIVPRVFMRGTAEEMKAVMNYYGKDRTRDVLTQTRYLDKVTLAFCTTIFEVPKEEFRCYKLSQSIPQLWDF